ncbi:hypothetical protein V6N13_133979 [Hibiscus sabdariffa]
MDSESILLVDFWNTGPEGWRLRQRHFEMVTSIVRSSRRFFPAGSASEIWCTFNHPAAAAALEEWISAKDYSDGALKGPKWHVPSDEEVQFANELLVHHFQSALDDLLRICQTKIHSDPGHFLKNLKSQLPQTRILAISALNTLLKDSPHKISADDQPVFTTNSQENAKSALEGALREIFQEEGFFNETLNSLSHVHIITDTDSGSSRGNHGNSSFQSLADKSITRFYFDFSASWPRTPSWISLLGSDTFYSNFARIFKRLIQECGMPVLLALKSTLEEFVNSKERSKQCVAAEAFAGVLHSDINGLLEEWDSWMMVQLQHIILAQSVESIPEWAACIRYAVTGKGKNGTRVPLLRQQILNCLLAPLPPSVTTTVVAKRYVFISAALIELSPQNMPVPEIELHNKLLDELLGNMCHSSAQETSNKDLSTLAKAAFELLKWRIILEPHLQKAVSVILSSANDPNWRTRSATLTYLRTFMFRHTFILSKGDKQKIWETVERLLQDSQVEVLADTSSSSSYFA